MSPLELLSWAHPLLATVTLLLCFVTLRLGLHQRAQRTRRVQAPQGSLARHLRLGPVALALFVASSAGGLGSAVLLRKWEPLATWHGRLALVALSLFIAVGLLGRGVRAGQRERANAHGLLGVTGLFLGGLAALLGISLLP